MNKKIHIFAHIVWGTITMAIFSVATMLLWNALLPEIFGVASVNFWQALGLLVLCRMLFGGFGRAWKFAGGSHHWNHVHEKWHRMSDEERREFIKKRHLRHGYRHDFPDREEFEKKD
ncbi:MAG: hypothetical protein LBH84_02940 [Prevotellaceae bacterium]|jgi:hypothetical protein|nr:hypothetical protein [Prevotellaceae bacterium]